MKVHLWDEISDKWTIEEVDATTPREAAKKINEKWLGARITSETKFGDITIILGVRRTAPFYGRAANRRQIFMICPDYIAYEPFN